jgi:hypothetical protein
LIWKGKREKEKKRKKKEIGQRCAASTHHQLINSAKNVKLDPQGRYQAKLDHQTLQLPIRQVL